MARTVPGNGQVVTALVFGPDRWSRQAASLGVMTNTFSPGSAGVHRSGGASPRGYVGDRGFGVNRWAGRTTYQWQHWGGAAGPVLNPLKSSLYLGAGAGVAGQPGLPNTGQLAGGQADALAAMSLGPRGMR